MYLFSSASQICDPWPRTINGGSPPTEPNARTGELTPPGIICSARFCNLREASCWRVMAFPVKPINIAAAVATWGHPPPAVPGEAKLHRGLGASDYGSSTPIFTGNSFVRNIPATCRHYCGDSDMLF